jgi:type I site-specific restriction endonuclease
MNTRQDIATRMYQEQTPTKGKKKGSPDVVRGYFEIMNVAVTEYEFRNCIIDHNLENENGDLIDFTQPMQAWRLDPKIGQEINALIDERNQYDDEADDLAPLETVLSSSYSDEVSTFPSTTPSE